ncbi:MAG TPA: DUF5611 family protein [Candidatus Thermoplasmatota archaeon]|nr:DUF5611 family protein [Candidatus Thermoplasmatota archaeon]
MREYEIKRGHYKTIEGDELRKVMEEAFGTVTQDGDGYLTATFGAIKRIRVKVLAKDKIAIDSETDREASTDVARQTMTVWNQFLERVTGFNAKQRSQRLQKAAKAAEVPEA